MTGPFKYLNDGPIENMEIGKRNQNSNRGKLENTETNSEVKYFTTYIIQDGFSSAFEILSGHNLPNWENDLKKNLLGKQSDLIK